MPVLEPASLDYLNEALEWDARAQDAETERLARFYIARREEALEDALRLEKLEAQLRA